MRLDLGAGGLMAGLGAEVVARLDAEFAELESSWSHGCAEADPVEDSDCREYWERLAEVDQLSLESMTGDGDGEGDGGVPAWWAAEELAGGLAAAGRGLGRAGQATGGVVGVFDPGVVAGLEAVGALRSRLDGVCVALAVEAQGRGLAMAVGLSLVDWLRVRCPGLSRTEACQVQDVARAAGTHWGRDLAQGVVAGQVPVYRAAKVARTITRLAGSLDADRVEVYAQIATAAAADPAISDTDLAVVCKKLLVDLLDEKPREEAKETARQLRGVSARPLGQGMTRYMVDAPETDAALLDGILGGPLAAPQPGEDGGPDERCPAQRRYDALLTVITRGLGNPGAAPSTARASVMLTVAADPATGRPCGAAVTGTGRVLDPGQAGRFACLGDLTPVVLGEHGEPVALGRTARLATAGQFKALMVRDRHCTYPGCSLPGTWCDSHHVTWWSRGGPTNITNLALLCPRHHTLVHDKDLTATIHGSIVTWHL